MSFLNPVNLPVQRFKSTDAGAPQINYAARTAGDVKAVLKACLVTGYGSVASAGWSIANEVDHVCEFVSPDVAMSDYRLGIDDKAATKTDWYYQYQDVRTNPTGNSLAKAFSYHDKTHASNGWQLLVTGRGLLFIELIRSTVASGVSARVTYIGQVKTTGNNTGSNICYISAGVNSETLYPVMSFNAVQHISLSGKNTGFGFFGPIQTTLANSSEFQFGDVILDAALYIKNHDGGFAGRVPPLLLRASAMPSFDIEDVVVDGYSYTQITLGTSGTAALDTLVKRVIVALVPTDTWGY